MDKENDKNYNDNKDFIKKEKVNDSSEYFTPEQKKVLDQYFKQPYKEGKFKS